jgi:hypothetical protein
MSQFIKNGPSVTAGKVSQKESGQNVTVYEKNGCSVTA